MNGCPVFGCLGCPFYDPDLDCLLEFDEICCTLSDREVFE